MLLHFFIFVESISLLAVRSIFFGFIVMFFVAQSKCLSGYFFTFLFLFEIALFFLFLFSFCSMITFGVCDFPGGRASSLRTIPKKLLASSHNLRRLDRTEFFANLMARPTRKSF